MPFVAGPGPAPAQPVGVDLPELRAPLPDGFVADHDTALQHQLLDLTKAQREPVIQPHAVRDDLRRGIGVPCTTTMQRSRPPILAATRQLTNLTVPTDLHRRAPTPTGQPRRTGTTLIRRRPEGLRQ